MTKLLFAVKDTALNAYMEIWGAPTVAAANRAFADGINDQQTPMYKHPEDYELWILGEYDQETGNIKAEPPAMVTRGKDVAQQYNTTLTTGVFKDKQ